MNIKKDPKDMSLEELIEHRRGHEMTPEELEEQVVAIAVAESNHSSGNDDTTIETMRAVRAMDKATTKTD